MILLVIRILIKRCFPRNINNMTESEYETICKHCDKLLLDHSSSHEYMAISWLHIIREHPHFLKNYQHLLSSSNSNIKIKMQSTMASLLKLALWSRKILIALFTRRNALNTVKDNSVDLLFISHLLNYDKLSNESDFYFGEVARQYDATLIALIDHGRTSFRIRSHISKDKKNPYVVLSNVLNIVDEISIFLRLRRVSAKLKREAKLDLGISKQVKLSASKAAMSQSSATNLRIGIQVSRLVARLNPKCIVLTYEGHAWERVVYDMVRAISPDIKCVGYQHAALFRLQHAFFLDFSTRYKPDCILTPGPNSTDRLKSSLNLHGIGIVEFGSHRISTKSNASRGAIPDSNVERCLVLPEGIVDECNYMFNYALDCAKEYKDVEFIWRLHPVIQFGDLVKTNARLKTLPNNVVLSSSPIEDDIRSCQVALYRGTTAIINAICSGVRPVYIGRPGEMTIDPLFDIQNNWKSTVSSVEDLGEVFNGVVESSTLKDDKRAVINYASGFFGEIKYPQLLSCIDIAK